MITHFEKGLKKENAGTDFEAEFSEICDEILVHDPDSNWVPSDVPSAIPSAIPLDVSRRRSSRDIAFEPSPVGHDNYLSCHFLELIVHAVDRLRRNIKNVNSLSFEERKIYLKFPRGWGHSHLCVDLHARIPDSHVFVRSNRERDRMSDLSLLKRDSPSIHFGDKSMAGFFKDADVLIFDGILPSWFEESSIASRSVIMIFIGCII